MYTVGKTITRARTELGISQKELAQRVTKEDGSSISPQYLNDIERDRRNPPAGNLLDRFAEELGVSHDYLHFLARRLPGDIVAGYHEPEQVQLAFRELRRKLKE